jgi:hypothetical protein
MLGLDLGCNSSAAIGVVLELVLVLHCMALASGPRTRAAWCFLFFFVIQSSLIGCLLPSWCLPSCVCPQQTSLLLE